MLAMFLALHLLHLPTTGDEQSLHRRVAALPQSVRELIERRAMCNHWGGEEPYDTQRRRQIEQAFADLRCATVPGEASFLRRYFAASSEVAELLDRTADESGWVADSSLGQ